MNFGFMFAVRPDEKFAKSSQRVAQLFFFKNLTAGIARNLAK